MNERRFKANGLVLNCLDYGGAGKPPMLFVHGGSAHAHWWDFVAPAFCGDYHALALDQRGHGHSECPPEWGYGSEHYVSDLEQVIDTWGLGAPILIGHSMGAHNVLAYAARNRRKLRAMVAIDVPPDYSQRAVTFLRTFADKPSRRFESLEAAVKNFRLLPRETLARPEIIEHMARHTFKQLPDGNWTHKLDRRTLIREPLAVWDSLKEIHCPALIVKVSDSPVLSVEMAEKMVAMLPHGRLVQIPDAYHHVMLDNPRALIAALKSFVAELE
ncbi:MAG TPA: alpha/beta hydrolase [Candidatus Binataceae bacterium]|nr:alpha/beta hydrolase [Candidatus Binataceae bacterium]